LGLSPKSFKAQKCGRKIKNQVWKIKTISVRVKGRLDPIFLIRKELEEDRMRSTTWTWNRIVTFLICILLSGCATIPPEAPELSAELGNRISAIEDANLTLLHRFFDLKRNEVDRFIQDEWVPAFAEEVFSDPKMAKAWNTIVAENNPSERLKFLVLIGPKLQEKINKKRLELVQPLDDIERRIEQKLRDEYTQARAINNSITSFLLSASKITENRNRYLGMVGVTDEKIGKVIDEVNDAVADLLKRGKDVQNKVDRAEDYLKKLRELRDSFTNNEEE
jgi:hypothetical protein